jgi:hypothetical protein
MSDILNYQNGYTTRNGDPEIDRARGGIIKLKFDIPSETIETSHPCGGKIKTKAMKVEIEIDLEKLPLVNTASYKIEEMQTGPDTLEYKPLEISASFS